MYHCAVRADSSGGVLPARSQEHPPGNESTRHVIKFLVCGEGNSTGPYEMPFERK